MCRNSAFRRWISMVLAVLLAAALLCGCDVAVEDVTAGTQTDVTQTRPTVTEPEETELTETEPEETEPTQTEPEETEPTETEPTETEPEETEPTETEPEETEPEETQPEETEPTEPPEGAVEITMSFVGDCTFGRNQKAQYNGSFDYLYDTYGPDYFFKGVRDIFEKDDVTVINLEGPLTTSDDIQDKTWNHKGAPEYVSVMTGSSVEVATMGNNHRLDYGISGSDETVRVLKEAGVAYCFDGNYAMYETKGVKVGVVSVNGLVGYWGVKEWLQDGLDTLREAGCVIVVAAIHWGGDKVTEPEPYQEQMGEQVIDMGYDLVVGHHPHVLQAIRVYKGKFICYSLGNFCYGGSKYPKDMDSGIFQKTFTVVDGQLVEDLQGRFIPCRMSQVDDMNDCCPTVAEGEVYDAIMEKVDGYSSVYGTRLEEDGTVRVEMP